LRIELTSVGLPPAGALVLDGVLKPSGGGGTLASGISPLPESQPGATTTHAAAKHAAQNIARIRFNFMCIPRIVLARGAARRASHRDRSLAAVTDAETVPPERGGWRLRLDREAPGDAVPKFRIVESADATAPIKKSDGPLIAGFCVWRKSVGFVGPTFVRTSPYLTLIPVVS